MVKIFPQKVSRTKMKAFTDFKVTTTDYELAAEYYNNCMKSGIQGSAIDLLICAISVRNKFEIYTEDGDFKLYKKCLPIKLRGIFFEVRIL
jgi:predicted nucleic acid-binding protein